MRTATAAELSSYLANGLGRAHAVLEGGADASLIDALIAACLRNPTYDPQVEGSRAPFLFELVQLAGATDRLAAALGDLLAGDPGDHDIEQRFELAGLLARDGLPAMRDALYRGQEQLIDRWLVERPNVLPLTEPARQLIAIDGVRGAVFAFAQLGRAAQVDPEFWDDDELLREVTQRVEDDDVDRVLEEARTADPRLDAYLGAVEQQTDLKDDRDARESRSPWWEAPWAVAKQTIERYVRGTDRIGCFTSQWGENASDEQLALAAKALLDLPRNDLELLRPYLCVFQDRPFPLDPSPLIDLIDDRREKVAWFAVNALKQLHHPAIRAVGLRMAERGPRRERALDLLARNWEPGDAAIAERLLRREGQPERVHTLCLGLCDVIDSQSMPELVPALLLAYERTPCSVCREQFVASLVRLNELPDTVRAECRWDAREETRQLVASAP